MIHVVNKHSMPKVQFGDILENVMFTNGSILGNPFYKKAKTDRPGSIDDFRKWLWNRIKPEAGATKERIEIERLAKAHKNRTIYLQCCCTPKACHGHIIKKAIQWYETEFLNN